MKNPSTRSTRLATRRSGAALGAFGLVVAIVLVSLNLRPAIVAVGPLTEAIQSDTGMNASMMSLLTTVPVICLGVFAVAASPLARRMGFEVGVLIAVVLILCGSALRLFDPVPALFVGSIVAGCGIALGNVLIPSLIKRDFERHTGVMMALYSVALQVGATIGAGLTLPLGSALGLQWRASLAIWGTLAAVAVLAWLPVAALSRTVAGTPGMRYQVWRSRLGWSAGAFIGLQSGVFFALSAWMPSLLQEGGMSADRAGFMVSVVAFMGIVGGLPMPLLAARVSNQRWLVVCVISAFMLGLIGLLIDPVSLALPSAVVLGLGQGAGLSLALTLFNLRSRTASGAAQLSGMAQSVGYVIAALAPFMVGAVHDVTGEWNVPIIILLLTLAPLAVTGWAVARPRLMEEEAQVVP